METILGVLFITPSVVCTLSEEIITDLLKDDLESAVLEDGIWKNPERESTKNKKPGSNYAEHIYWYVRRSEKDLISDIEVLQNHPLVPSHIDIFGFIFDINSGELKLID